MTAANSANSKVSFSLREAIEDLNSSRSGATVTKAKMSSLKVPLQRITTAGFCKKIDVALSAEEEALIQESYDRTLDKVLGLLAKKDALDPDQVSLSINYQTNVVTVFYSKKLIKEISFQEIPGASKIEAMLKGKKLFFTFGKFSSDSSIGPNDGSGLDPEVSKALQGIEFKKCVSYMFPKCTDCVVGDSFEHVCYEKYGSTIEKIREELLLKVNAKIKEINDENEEKIQAKKGEITRVKDAIANSKNPAATAQLIRNKEKFEEELKLLEKNIENQNELTLLEEQRSELVRLDMFALRMVLLAIMSFVPDKNYPNYYDEKLKIPYDLTNDKHRIAAAKFINRKMQRAVVDSWRLGWLYNTKNLSPQEKNYCAKVALMLAKDRTEAAQLARELNIDLPHDSLERRILHKALEISEIDTAELTGTAKTNAINSAIETLFEREKTAKTESIMPSSVTTPTMVDLSTDPSYRASTAMPTMVDLSTDPSDSAKPASSSSNAADVSEFASSARRAPIDNGSTSSSRNGVFNSTSSSYYW